MEIWRAADAPEATKGVHSCQRFTQPSAAHLNQPYRIVYIGAMQSMPVNSEALLAFRENVRDILERREISIATMAEDLKMSRPGLSRVLHGHESLSIQRAEKIAKFLGVPLAKLIVRKKLSHAP